jgi:hypothetical protein
MIFTVRPLYSGNALHLSLVPPTGATQWRVLRKGSDDFTGEGDPDAYVAYEGSDRSIVDSHALQNELPAFYRAYYWDGSVWTPSATATGTPQATYQDASTDALSIVRDRLEAGLAVEVARGVMQPKRGYIQVLTAPPIADGGVELPVVTVHLTNEDQGERGIGEMVEIDQFDELSGQWTESEGWLANVRLDIVGWCLNPDERIELRKALRRIVVANLPVFDAAGMVEITFGQQDADALNGEYSSNIYQVICSFGCMAPVKVTNSVNPITDVQVTANGEYLPVTI